MGGQMCWLAQFGGNGTLILHLRFGPQHPWRPYTHFPALMVPDYRIPGASKGFATSQKLLAASWALLSTEEVKASFNPSPNSSQAA